MQLSGDGKYASTELIPQNYDPSQPVAPGQIALISLATDTTPPTVTGTPAGTPMNGWYNNNVTVNWSAADPDSTSTTPAPTTASSEGTNTYTSAPSCDPSGNCAIGSINLNIDKTAPTVGSYGPLSMTAGTSQTLTVPAIDNPSSPGTATSGVIAGEYFVGTADPGIGNGHPMVYDGNSLTPMSGDTTLSNLPASATPYQLNVRAEDAAGNWSPVTTAQLTVTNPTIGNPQPGNLLDSSDANFMNGTKFTVGSVGGTATTMSVYIGTVDSSPHNQYQMSVYTTKSNGKPGTLVAQTAAGNLTANSWNSLPLSGTLSPNTQYWLMYNTNASQSGLNDMYYTTDEQGIGAYAGRTYGSWPATYPTGPVMTNQKFSLTLSFAPSGPLPPNPTPLVGDANVESNIDSNPAGTAEAFSYTATSSGTAGNLQVYLNGTNVASQVVVGLYSDTSGAPGTLLGQATITAPVDGAWNTVALPTGVSVTSGTKYWIAILGPKTKGVVGFRDQATGGTGSHTSSQTNLTTLPATWSDGSTYATTSLSGFAY